MEIAGSMAATDMTTMLAANAILDSLYSVRPMESSAEMGFLPSLLANVKVVVHEIGGFTLNPYPTY